MFEYDDQPNNKSRAYDSHQSLLSSRGEENADFRARKE